MSGDVDASRISPFLLRKSLVRLAEQSDRSELELLDASRGAANWQQRRVLNAWHCLGLFAAHAAAAPAGDGNVALALHPDSCSFAAFARFAAEHQGVPEIADGCGLLACAWDWLAGEVLPGWSRDRIVYEFAEAVAGRRYPDPPTLDFVRPIMSRYLAPLLFGGDADLAGRFRVFACEGATTGITQVTATLARNGVISPGDKVAMWWPTYEPLRDLVECQLQCEVVPIRRDAALGWRVPPSEFDKLGDPALRLVIMVSPGNPLPTVTDPASLDALQAMVTRRPDTLILADYVYMHFLDEPVETEIARLPRNTIGVYSVSKDFGLAGARVGMVLVHDECVADRLLAESATGAECSARRYCRRSADPAHMPLLERMIADSRGISFDHMSGLSTPLQVLACLCACFDLIEPDAPEYFGWVRGQLRGRLAALYEGLGVDLPAWADGPSSRYATTIDLCEVARVHGGDELARRLSEGEVWPFMQHLASRWRVVLTVGQGFGSGEWSVRACFPSVDADQARELGSRVARAVVEHAGAAEPARTSRPV